MSKENIVKLHYSSFLTEVYLEDLKSLMFFNQNQHKVMPGILESIERYGLPQLNIQNGMIRVTVGKIKDVQTIFVLDQTDSANELIGVIVFFRESADNITLLHIAVKEEYSLHSLRSETHILFRMIDKLRESSKKISGVKTITIIYNKDISKKIKV